MKRNKMIWLLIAGVLAGVGFGLLIRKTHPSLKLSTPIFRDVREHPASDPMKEIEAICSTIPARSDYLPLVMDYPFEGSVFPPDMVAPTFLWHDDAEESDSWLVEVGFENSAHHLYVLTSGKQAAQVIDPEAVRPTNAYWKRSEYDISAQAWMPDGELWEIIKQNSVGKKATVTLYGLDSRNGNEVVSMGRMTLTTSPDPVDAPIFYRDVPLMPSSTKQGGIKPIADDALPLIAWRLRDISKPSAPALLKDMPTCANCHSFSANGKMFGMDLDGPDGDKGAYVFTEVSKEMVVEEEDIITWNSYKGTPKEHKNFGLFSRVSPDGRYVVSTLNESTFVVNYPKFEFLQSFYPTRGILVVYDRKTGEMTPLPGADNPYFVQTNGNWSPDGKRLVFSRAVAKNNYESREKAEFAGDARETFIQYDLYSIDFNNGKGGIATPVAGASKNGMSNSFPKFSPDGKWIVYVQSSKGQLMRPDSKLYIIPAQGGVARKLDCNLHPMNSWHSWSPNSRWLVFSSKGFRPFTQMFLTHIDPQGNDTPAILIPNSTADNRAVNIPEFLNGAGNEIESIKTPTQESYRFFNQATVLTKKSDYAGALPLLDRSIEMNPYYAKAHNNKGFVLFKLGRVKEAMTSLNQALELDSDTETSHRNIAFLLHAEGHSTEAIAYLKKIIAQNPNQPQLHEILAGIYKLEGQPKQAIAHYQHVAKLNPYKLEIQAKLGALFMAEKEYDQALQSYKAALKDGVNPSGIHHNMGKAYLHQQKTELAIGHFKKSIEANSKNMGSLCTLGALLEVQGQGKEAEGYLKKALEIEPENLEIRQKLARILFGQHQIESCIEQYEILLKQQPQKISMLNNLAWLLSAYPEPSDPKRAVELAKKACDLTQNNEPTLLNTLAVAHAAAGDFKQAVACIEKSIELIDPSTETTLLEETQNYLELFENEQPFEEKEGSI